jgi:integrase/recombinase XerD
VIRPLPAPTFGHAAEAFVIAHEAPGAWAKGTAVKYRQTLAAIGGQLAEATPCSAADVAVLGTPAGASALEAAFTAAFGTLAPATRARHLSALRSAITWWTEAGWVTSDPTAGWARPKVPVDTTRALTRAQVAAIWKLDVPLRDKALWRMLYETAARAEEVLGLDVPDLDLPSKRGRVISKGGSTDWVHWQTGTALLLPRLLAGRREGPAFLTARKPGRPVATGDLCPSPSGRACPIAGRETFELATRPLANPSATREELQDASGWTLHQLRHSLLTHEAEDGTSTPMLLARSRHASVRSLERYARPGPEAVARHVAASDPAARRNR